MAKFLAMFLLLPQLISFNVFGEELESLPKPALLNKPTLLHPPANGPLHHHHNRNLSPTSARTPLHPSHHAKPPTHHHHQHHPAHARAPVHHHQPPAHAPIYHHQHLHPAKPPTHHHHQHPPAHARAPIHHHHPPAHAPIYHLQHPHLAKPPTHHNHSPTHAPVHHHQPLHPVKPPTDHHHQHPPAHAPVQPPTRHHYRNNPPSQTLVHKPTPIHPPFHVPIPIKSRIAVEGVVYVKSCKHARVDTLLNATSLNGAVVKLQCNKTNHNVVRKGKTDKNGYFYIKGSKDISSFAAHKCNVVLDSAPNGLKPSNLHGGITGAVLKRKKSFVSKGHVFILYNVKPLAFEPKCTH